jgi:hypothetical protein
LRLKKAAKTFAGEMDTENKSLPFHTNTTEKMTTSTAADQAFRSDGDRMAGMSHSEVHYFNSYNHHGIHEEMLVGTPDTYLQGVRKA